MGRRLAALAVLIGAPLALAACAEGFTREAAVDSFAEANPDVTSEQAECVVDELIDRLSLAQVEVELAAEPVSASFEEDQFRAMFRCGVVGDVERQVVEQLEASGVSDEHSPCVADALVGAMSDEDVDVLLSGEITDAFAAKFRQAMDDCDALNP